MSQEKTLAIIKPDAVGRNLIGSIIKIIEDNNIIISEMKMLTLSKSQAEEFYEVHKDKEFYDGLITYMTSGPIVAAILEKDNAVVEFRNLIGSTDPSDAENGTIRKEFAESKAKNAIHGSDSDKNAKIESDFFFSKFERF